MGRNFNGGKKVENITRSGSVDSGFVRFILSDKSYFQVKTTRFGAAA